MYVCLCNDLKCRDVRAARDRGARTPAQVFRAHETRPQCGKCIGCMKDILNEDRPAPSLAQAS